MKIVVDLSPLDTESRLRGIGRYVLGLLSGFRELKATGQLDLDIEGVAQFDWLGSLSGSVGLDYDGTKQHPDHFKLGRYRMRKRLGLGRASASLGAQLLHVTEPIALPWGTRLPIILTCHDLIPLRLPEHLAPFPWSRALRQFQDTHRYRPARRIIAVSHATKRDLTELLGIEAARIDVAHLGVDHERFTECPTRENESSLLRQRYGLTKPYVLYLGSFDSRKSVPLLIQAFANAGMSADFDLVLGGAMRERYRQQIMQQVQDLGIQSAIRLLGFVDDEDLPALYRACHVHVFPSIYEGFGLPVAEALACGAPTITVSTSSLPEVAGDAAVLVPPGNLEALTVALVALCNDNAARDALKCAGPKQANQFRWRDCAKQTLLSYKKALNLV